MVGLRTKMSLAAGSVVLLLAVSATFSVSAVDHVQVRVRQTPGGPQIFVNGKPMPPHMFWGREIVAPQRVTGFAFKRVEGFGRVVRSTSAGRAAGLPDEWANRWKRGIAPRFAVEPEPGDEVWATWDDGSAAVVVRPHGKGNEVFFGSIEMPREFLAALVKRAGVFVSLEHPERATLWRADEAMTLQAMEDGEQTLRFPVPTTVKDDLTGETLGNDVTRLQIVLRKGEVSVFIFPLAQRTPFWHD